MVVSTNYPKPGILFSLLLLAAPGCVEPESPIAPTEKAAYPAQSLDKASSPVEIPEQTPVKTATTRYDSWIAVPAQWRLPNPGKVEAATSWENRISKLPQDDQAWLRKLNERYDGALGFLTREEQQWMISQGFPMPEEWLAARAMPDSEIQRLAQSGNAKAQLFYMDRLSERLSPILASGHGLGNSAQDRDLLSQLSKASTGGMMLLRSTRSPAAAYLYGELLSSSAQYTPPEAMAGALLLAADLGDPRAKRLQAEYSRRHPDLNGNSVMAAYNLMKTVVQNPEQ